MPWDLDNDLERLKAKKAELSSKISATRNFQLKEKLKEELIRIENQIKFLELMKRKSF